MTSFYKNNCSISLISSDFFIADISSSFFIISYNFEKKYLLICTLLKFTAKIKIKSTRNSSSHKIGVFRFTMTKLGFKTKSLEP